MANDSMLTVKKGVVPIVNYGVILLNDYHICLDILAVSPPFLHKYFNF